jgi:hypothetical protein
MQLDSLQAIMNNTLWIGGDVANTWVEAGVAVGAPSDDGLTPEYTQFYYAGQQNPEGSYQTRFLGLVPFNDVGTWANVYVFDNFNGSWSTAVESLNSGLLTMRAGWDGNTMRAAGEDIGLELANGDGPEAYADLAYFTNTRWRTNDGQYRPQTSSGHLVPVDDPPISAGWINRPEDSPGGLWYTRTR